MKEQQRMKEQQFRKQSKERPDFVHVGEEKSYFLRVVESISPDEKELLRKYKSTRRVVKGDIPSLEKLRKRRKGIIWHDGYLDEDIKPKQLVGLTIFGGWVYVALVEKEKG